MGIFSAITGVFGAAQSASAYSNAASERGRGLRQGADTVDRTKDAVNESLSTTAAGAGAHVEDIANGAGVAVVNAGVDARRRGDEAARDANGLLNPYINAGTDAVTRMSDMAGNGKFEFSEDDPSYKWRMEQGQKALERNVSARGMNQSGGTLKALTRYAQGLASTEYGAAFDRFERSRTRNFNELSSLATGGLQASGRAGENLINAAQYGGNAVLGAETNAGTFRTNAAKYNGDVNVRASENMATNSVNAGAYRAGAETGIADANASSYLGRAGAWNGALEAIGGGLDGFMAGGFSGSRSGGGGTGGGQSGGGTGGGGGFNWGDAFRGYAPAPMAGYTQMGYAPVPATTPVRN
jgi:hypothetical protein